MKDSYRGRMAELKPPHCPPPGLPLHHAPPSSSNALFPEAAEGEPRQFYPASSTRYSPLPEASTYSGFSQDSQFIFNPQLASSKRDDSSVYSEIGPLEEHRRLSNDAILAASRDRCPGNDSDHVTAAEEDDQFNQDIYANPLLSGLGFRARNNSYDGPPCAASSYLRRDRPGSFGSAQSRRRTWSPPTFERMMGSSGSVQAAIRSYRSNDQLDNDIANGNNNQYEELEVTSNLSSASAPPKITPVSGSLVNMSAAPSSLIKPIAFKPIVTAHARYVSTPQRHRPDQSPSSHQMSPQQSSGYPGDGGVRSANHSHDDGYISQDYHSHSNSNVSSQGSLPIENGSSAEHSFTNGYDAHYSSANHHHQQHHQQHHQLQEHSSSAPHQPLYNKAQRPPLDKDRPDSYTSNLSRVSSHQGDAYMQTPSPSDSGVGELEAMLRDKDAEIQRLRDTMERNESAILQVCEEKRRSWVMEMRELNAEWEKRLRFQQQKAFKTEQGLLLQLFKLQQERKNLRLDVEQLRADKDRLELKYGEVEHESKHSKTKMEELQWDLCQKSGEISLLKTQLKEAKEDATNKATDVIGVKSKLKDISQERDSQEKDVQKLKVKLDESKADLLKAQDCLQLVQKQLDSPCACRKAQQPANNNNQPDQSCDLEAELSLLRAEMATTRAEAAHDRELWLEEKNKVIRYQKHLQLNYVQMMRKNKVLEAEVEQLTLELERRDISLMTKNEDEDEEESMC